MLLLDARWESGAEGAAGRARARTCGVCRVAGAPHEKFVSPRLFFSRTHATCDGRGMVRGTAGARAACR